MTEKELIIKLQELKNIKPRENWVVFAKAELFSRHPVTVPPVQKGAFSFARNIFSQKSFAYAFSALLMVLTGVFGLAQYTLPGDALFPIKENTEHLQASLKKEAGMKNTVVTLKKRSQDLAKVVKDKKEANIPSAIDEVRSAAKDLTDAIEKDPAMAKDIALELKNSGTLAALDGGSELKEASDMLYKTIAAQMIDDLKAATLAEKQKEMLVQIQEFYDQGSYLEALEKILLINN